MQLTDSNAAEVAELCRRLEGIPLAIELAAARIQVLTPAQMLSHLDRRLDFLVSRRRDVADRHRTLRAAVAWSYEMLSPELQRFFARLSVFRRGFLLPAALDVCDEPLALDFLQELCECSLVIADTVSGTPTWHAHEVAPDNIQLLFRGGPREEQRYRLLETLREFGAERLDGREETEAMRKRHLAYYCEAFRLAHWGIGGSEREGLLRWFDHEAENVHAALNWGIEHEPELALELASSLMSYWILRASWSEARQWLQRALACAPGASPLVRVRSLWQAGNLALLCGDYAGAQELLGQTITVARTCPVPPDDHRLRSELQEHVGAALVDLGHAAYDHGDFETARRLCRESLEIRRTMDKRWSMAQITRKLGDVDLAEGSIQSARAHYQQALDAYRALADPGAEAGLLDRLGMLASLEGEFAAAHAHCQKAIDGFRSLNDRPGLAAALRGQGDVAMAAGRAEEARPLYGESLELSLEMGSRIEVTQSLERLARALIETGELETGARLLAAADRLREEMATPVPPVERPEQERALQRLRAGIGEPAFNAARTEGRSLAMQDAVRLALANAPAAPAPPNP